MSDGLPTWKIERMSNNWRVELIEWLDSFGAGQSWTPFDEIDHDVELSCTSVGYVVRETEKYVLIVPHIHGKKTILRGEREVSAAGCGDMAIPKSAIIRRVILGETSAELAHLAAVE